MCSKKFPQQKYDMQPIIMQHTFNVECISASYIPCFVLKSIKNMIRYQLENIMNFLDLFRYRPIFSKAKSNLKAFRDSFMRSKYFNWVSCPNLSLRFFSKFLEAY